MTSPTRDGTTPFRVEFINSARYNSKLQDDERYVQITIEDGTSGEILAQIQLSAEQFTQLLTNTSIRVDGFHTPHLDRIGKKMQVESFRVPKAMEATLPKSDRSGADYDAPARKFLQDWVNDLPDAQDWDQASPSHHNYGWSITRRRWREEA